MFKQANAAFVIALVVLGQDASSLTRAESVDVNPALQGHAAEMRMRSEADEQRRRALFFDDVDAEFGRRGLPCDHLVRSRPQAIAGSGSVVVITAHSAPPVRVRVWIPPEAAIEQAAAVPFAEATAASRLPNGVKTSTESQSFLWCKSHNDQSRSVRADQRSRDVV